MAAVVTNRSGPINLVRDIPKDALNKILKCLTIWDIADFIGTCRYTARSDFSDTPLRLRYQIRVLNHLRICSPIAEDISLQVFKTLMLSESDNLVSHIVKFVEIENLFLLRIALSSKKMTIELREEAVEEAASYGQLFALNILLANGKISKVSRGEAVKYAAMHGYLSSIQVLLASGPIDDWEREEAIFQAVIRSHSSSLIALLSIGPISYNMRSTAILSAAERGDLLSLKALLASGPIDDWDRGTAVHTAAVKGHLSCLEALISSGSISDDNRDWAVRRAAEEGHHSCVRQLLKDLNERPDWLNKAIDVARKARKKDVVAFLEAWKPKEQKSLLSAVPKDVLVKVMFKYLPIREIARFIGACYFTTRTFSETPLRLRYHVRVLNNLRICSAITEHISLKVFRKWIQIERDKLVSHIVTFVETENLFLLRIALSSKKMTSDLRVKAVIEAALCGQLFALNMLLENGEIFDWARDWAVSDAAVHGHFSCIRTLLSSGPVLVHSRGVAVYRAAEGGHLSFIQEFLKGLNERPCWFDEIIKKAREAGKADVVAYLEAWKPEEK